MTTAKWISICSRIHAIMLQDLMKRGVYRCLLWGWRCPNTITLGCLETEKSVHLCERVIIIITSIITIITIIIMSSSRREKCWLGFCWVAPPFPSFAFCVFWKKKKSQMRKTIVRRLWWFIYTHFCIFRFLCTLGYYPFFLPFSLHLFWFWFFLGFQM